MMAFGCLASLALYAVAVIVVVNLSLLPYLLGALVLLMFVGAVLNNRDRPLY